MNDQFQHKKDVSGLKPVQEGGLRTRGLGKESRPDRPLVSVITVVLNGEQHIEETIRSVVGQSYTNIEYIIIDGASQDRTLEIIKNHDAEIDYWISAPDFGIYDAMNKGIQSSRGELINLLNADDYLLPDAVQTVVSRYQVAKMPCIIYGDYYLIDDVLGYKTEMRSNLNYWLGMTVSHQTMFVQREVYDSLGMYATKFRLASDYDFLLRAVKNGLEFVHVGETVAVRRLHGRGGRNYLLSKRETNSINSAYYRHDISHRIRFCANLVLDTIKLGIIRGLHILLGPGNAKSVLMQYYKARAMRCFSISDCGCSEAKNETN